LINVQNQGHGFLSATEFASSIVDPVQNVLTYGIDVQEGVLDHVNGDYIGAVYTADYGALGTGILIQNSSPSASWQNAIQYSKNGNLLFSVDGLGNIVGSSGYFGSFQVNLATPSSSSAPCTAGQIGADAKYIYVCVATNQWKRSALSSF
jgi:hypothetical protein